MPAKVELPQSLPVNDNVAQNLDASALHHRVAMNELTTIRWSVAEDIEAYKLWNIPAIGVSWRKLLEFGVQKGVRLLRQSDMSVSNVGWVGGFTGHNGFGHSEVMLDAKRAVRVAGQLRSPAVTVLTGPQNRHINSHARRLAVSALCELADLAASYNVSIALQPMHQVYQQNWSFIHSLDDALELIEKVNHPAVKLAFGTYHLGGEEGVCSRIRSIVDKIAVVHLSDCYGSPQHENDREVPGEGHLPLREIVYALESAGYDGWYETEVWSPDLWKMDHHDLIERCLRSQAALFSNELKTSFTGLNTLSEFPDEDSSTY
ncbi:sugar phosphate isomerase/epimerase family protein [Thalassoglobus polymorphus]|uniref:Inosose isomerase n=1 Tax=Thalassoglobus polymorphus TaxID=2527994 RepID=A0A517QUM9_9PLAN|nr:sugar phosphate isomerase/epimerase family protein [Thalassoglobus polymorphus]QDT35342.1 Inosose isomerase [Thalassoglobus polymorphus]